MYISRLHVVMDIELILARLAFIVCATTFAVYPFYAAISIFTRPYLMGFVFSIACGYNTELGTKLTIGDVILILSSPFSGKFKLGVELFLIEVLLGCIRRELFSLATINLRRGDSDESVLTCAYYAHSGIIRVYKFNLSEKHRSREHHLKIFAANMDSVEPEYTMYGFPGPVPLFATFHRKEGNSVFGKWFTKEESIRDILLQNIPHRE